MRAVYHKGSEHPDLEPTWAVNGEVISLVGRTFELTAFPFGGTVALTKTTGFTPTPPDVDDTTPAPNLTVQWDDGELDTLDAGTYVLKFVATDETGPLEMYGELVIRENAPNFGYCELPDMASKLGDLQVPTSVNLYDYINAAADEMNASLGQLYTLPLDLAAAPGFVTLSLKKINAYLAAGQYIAARAIPTEDDGLQAYAAWLLKTAYDEMKQIMTGVVELTGVPRVPDSFRSTAPVIANRDEVSAFESFENHFMRDDLPVHIGKQWQPGAK